MSNGEDQNTPGDANQNRREGRIGLSERLFRRSIFVSFYWIVFGVCVIFGFRLYHDAPIHASFMPVVMTCFAVVTAFIVVLTLNFVVGEIKFEVPGVKFEGASGPIVLWVLCFLAIAFSLASIYESVADESADEYHGKSVGDLIIED